MAAQRRDNPRRSRMIYQQERCAMWRTFALVLYRERERVVSREALEEARNKLMCARALRLVRG